MILVGEFVIYSRPCGTVGIYKLDKDTGSLVNGGDFDEKDLAEAVRKLYAEKF